MEESLVMKILSKRFNKITEDFEWEVLFDDNDIQFLPISHLQDANGTKTQALVEFEAESKAQRAARRTRNADQHSERKMPSRMTSDSSDSEETSSSSSSQVFYFYFIFCSFSPF